MYWYSVRRFFARKSRESFKKDLNHEIFAKMFLHLRHEREHGYPFSNDTELVAQTEAINLNEMLAEVERQITALPCSYGQCFRYQMRKDLAERLQAYAWSAKRYAPRVVIDQRRLACHARLS